MSLKSWVYIVIISCVECACTRSAQSHLERANKLYDASKYADAELQYREGIAKDPKSAEAYYRLGLTEVQLQKLTAALADFQRAVALNPANEMYRVQQANLALLIYEADPSAQKLYDQVASEADRLLQQNAGSFDGLRLRADVLIIDRKPDEALTLLKKANAIQPSDPNVILPMVRALLALGRTSEADDIAGQFLKKRKDFEPMYELMLRYYGGVHRMQDAERLLQQEIASRPKDVRPLLQLAALYDDARRYPEMSQTLQRILSNPRDFPEGPGLVGDFYASVGKWDDALREYRRGAQSNSKHKELYEKKIADALIATGHKSQALTELEQVLKTAPGDTEARLARATLLRDSSDPKQLDLALSDLKDLADHQPRSEIVHYNLGLAYLAKGQLPAAQAELKESAALKADYAAPRLILGTIAEGRRDFSEALRISAEILQTSPDNTQAKLLHASGLTGIGSYDQARRELEDILRVRPASREANLLLAKLELKQKKYQDAEARLQRSYQVGSSDLRPLEGLVEVYLGEGSQQKAEHLLDQELRRQPDSRPLRLLMANIAIREGRFDTAKQQCKWLLSKDPNSADGYQLMGDLDQRQGDANAAIDNYQKASRLAPNDPKILSNIAVLQTNAGKNQDAISTLQRILTRDPENPVAMNNLAFNLAEIGTDLDRALTLAQMAVRKVPDNPDFADTLGWVYTKRNVNDSAIRVFRTLVNKYPNEAAFRYHLGVALLQDKQVRDAESEFAIALSKRPSKLLAEKIQESSLKAR
jgi:tetratricopeptide (TPR) repeat protein